jgi:DNA-directed RNA polymerase subunit beta'
LSKGTPSRIGHLLDLSPRNLERVLYFAQYIIISVDDQARKQVIEELQQKLQEEIGKKAQVTQEKLNELDEAMKMLEASEGEEGVSEQKEAIANAIVEIEDRQREEESALRHEYQELVDELEDLRPMKLLSESRYRELRERVGAIFHAGMGAEAIQEILASIDLGALREKLTEEMGSSSGQRRRKAVKRLWVVDAFRNGDARPEWMVLSVLPVLPPELRPMVQLDGGRFATSDLNDLYRRVINRNNRLRRLLDLGAPDIIVRNEKRMLQEAVDALIDNGRRGRPIQGSHNHKLKSLSDLLRGKQGRFRQNLLGKRVDYSGRSVIVSGPELQLHQCGLPRRMALELFKPFVMNRLVVLGMAPNIKSAKRMVERSSSEVWDILEEVAKQRPVLLNRAPTLHRLGLQAFQPVLIEGNAIQIHPLVCSAFNADFDGDQMAVHVPLSKMAVLEAKKVMLSVYNMLSPASGEPLVAPTLDMVLGCYYLTDFRENAKGEGKKFIDFNEARLAYDTGHVDLRAKISLRDESQEDGWLETSVGRIILNEVLPPEMGFQNKIMDKSGLKDLATDCYRVLGNEGTAAVLDKVKTLGFHYATEAGLTISISDIRVPKEKTRIIDEANEQVETLEGQYMMGLISEDERYNRAVEIWTKASDAMTDEVEKELPEYGGIAIMAMSGAKGNIGQIKQMAGMRGLMSNPKGRILDLPVKSSFREGLSVLEYFISTHGARKGLADTALRTADSGYLTRRLVDVAQEILVLEDDCGILEDEQESAKGIWVEEVPNEPLLASMEERILGRLSAEQVLHPETDEVLVDRNELIDENKVAAIMEAGVKRVYVRSPLTCRARRGICMSCYGRSLATGQMALLGEAVGVIAAQSIGEPGTQLTMRTFHTGGVAGTDITSGLPRVEELFEARTPKGASILSDIEGEVEVIEEPDGRTIKVVSREVYREEYALPKGYELTVEDGDPVDPGTVLARLSTEKDGGNGSQPDGSEMMAEIGGRVEISSGKVTKVTIVWEDEDPRENHVPALAHLLVKTGDHVRAGDALTAGPLNPHDILRIRGKEEVQKYLVEEVQRVYRSQGVTINDRHIEVIGRQLLRRVQVESSGDTNFLPGQYVERFTFHDENARCIAEGGEPATARPVLLGVTRASLQTESFLSAASFQETTRVLTEAAVRGAEDRLQALKENVIIGRLIPARFEISDEGRERLGREELEALERPPEPEWLQEGEVEQILGEEQTFLSAEPSQGNGLDQEGIELVEVAPSDLADESVEGNDD